MFKLGFENFGYNFISKTSCGFLLKLLQKVGTYVHVWEPLCIVENTLPACNNILYTTCRVVIVSTPINL